MSNSLKDLFTSVSSNQVANGDYTKDGRNVLNISPAEKQALIDQIKSKQSPGFSPDIDINPNGIDPGLTPGIKATPFPMPRDIDPKFTPDGVSILSVASGSKDPDYEPMMPQDAEKGAAQYLEGISDGLSDDNPALVQSFYMELYQQLADIQRQNLIGGTVQNADVTVETGKAVDFNYSTMPNPELNPRFNPGTGINLEPKPTFPGTGLSMYGVNPESTNKAKELMNDEVDLTADNYKEYARAVAETVTLNAASKDDASRMTEMIRLQLAEALDLPAPEMQDKAFEREYKIYQSWKENPRANTASLSAENPKSDFRPVPIVDDPSESNDVGVEY